MQMIAAPARQMKTWSWWLTAVLAALNALNVVTGELGKAEVPLIDPGLLAQISTGIGALAMFVRIIKQDIAVTTEEKVETIEAAAAQRVKAGQLDVTAHVLPVSATTKDTP